MNNIIENSKSEHTLLIVDDSIENLQLLTGLLKDNYKIKVAKNGLKAIEIVENDQTIDLILMDVMMPEMDGFQACKIIKSKADKSHIPIIFLTALNEASDETLGFESGGSDFITKPFHAEVVRARVKTHIALLNEKRKSDNLLSILLPDKVIHQLKKHGTYQPEKHPDTSIMFCDLVGFTAISATMSPENLIQELTDIFTKFDEISSMNNVTRIKTIGDAYMAVSGLNDVEENHAENMVNAGLMFIDYLNIRNRTSQQQWKCRIGIHSGEIITGIVGTSRFQFDIMGDNVNIASRVESNGEIMEVVVTNAVLERISSNYLTQELGVKNLKGKGEMKLTIVKGRL
ncbi:MAG: hypothetical protein RI922_730 [Bacteroidota bacterium]|jgi:DNA-binding response OmpR family regulator